MIGCKWFAKFGPTDPNEPPEPYVRTEFERYAEVTYNRDPSKIKNPAANDGLTSAVYKLYDEKHEHSDIGDETYYDRFRLGSTDMIQTGEHSFKGTLKWVLIQSDPSHKKHIIFMQDLKLRGDGQSEFTSDGISVQGWYEVEIRGNEAHFKQRKIQNLE